MIKKIIAVFPVSRISQLITPDQYVNFIIVFDKLQYHSQRSVMYSVYSLADYPEYQIECQKEIEL